MRIVHGQLSGARGGALGIFSGAFHPVTLAHLALARAALDWVDQVLFVMPETFPHKEYDGVGLGDRIALLGKAVAPEPRFAVGISEGGLFTEIAEECRGTVADPCELWVLCGRDAAERILSWDYGAGPGIEDQLRRFGLLVAPRGGPFEPPEALAARVRTLSLAEPWDEVSSTAIRERIRRGEEWRHLVPEPVAAEVARLYGGGG